jgi:hypothetical protein
MKPMERRFQTVVEIQAESQATLNTLAENDSLKCFKTWQRGGSSNLRKKNYSEGDAGP